MPDRTTCPHCRKVGFVRREYVIKGGQAMIAFYCGSCDRSWQIEDQDPRDEKGSSRTDPARRSRRS